MAGEVFEGRKVASSCSVIKYLLGVRRLVGALARGDLAPLS
jgi:hypothetical protein